MGYVARCEGCVSSNRRFRTRVERARRPEPPPLDRLCVNQRETIRGKCQTSSLHSPGPRICYPRSASFGTADMPACAAGNGCWERSARLNSLMSYVTGFCPSFAMRAFDRMTGSAPRLAAGRGIPPRGCCRRCFEAIALLRRPHTRSSALRCHGCVSIRPGWAAAQPSSRASPRSARRSADRTSG